MQLKAQTNSSWIDAVMADFDTFLTDHAACERKASAMAMSMLSHYPDKISLVESMTDLAIEEMAHFRQVMRHIIARGVVMPPDTKDPYINALRKHIRSGLDHYFLDRLLLACVVEARGEERFAMLGEYLPEGKMKDLYVTIAKAEAKHHELFVNLAKEYFDEATVNTRLNEWLNIEADIVNNLPHRAALH